jgi:membrane protein
MVAKGLWRSIQQTAVAWLDHEGSRLAASLALYSLLSLAPLVILSIAIASLAFGRLAAADAIVKEVRSMMGAQGAQAIQSVIQYGSTPKPRGVASTLGIVVLLFGASSVFGELRSALNKIYEVKPDNKSGILALVKSRLVSFAMVLGLGFLLLVSLVFSALLAAMGGYFSVHLALPRALLTALNAVVSFAGISCLIALILRYVPDTKLRWRNVWEGAVTTAALFTAGKELLGLYLGKATVGSAYGEAGSLIVVIVWVYYSAMIFYFGAEFTCIRSRGAAVRKAPQPRSSRKLPGDAYETQAIALRQKIPSGVEQSQDPGARDGSRARRRRG